VLSAHAAEDSAADSILDSEMLAEFTRQASAELDSTRDSAGVDSIQASAVSTAV